MRYKAIIFDLDGVICHTDHYHYLAWKQLADRLNIYFDEDINNRLRGISRMESLAIILERYHGSLLSDEEKMSLANEKNEIYREYLKTMSPKDLSLEVKNTLESLKGNGIKLAIGSSSKNARIILKQLGVTNYFDAISDGNNISKSKPDPEVFLYAANALSISPEFCLVVEDAVSGIIAANAAGMDSAAVGDAMGCSSATYSIDGLADLLEICNIH